MRQLKLRQLRLLVVLDKHRHIGRAAAALNVTQPAVSKSLAELEAGLGLVLFERLARGMTPTEEGLCLIGHAHAVLEQIERAQIELDALHRPARERLRLGVLYGMAPMVSATFAQLASRGSPLEPQLTVHENSMIDLMTMLRARKLDLIIGSTPERVASADLNVVPLFAEPMVWIAPRRHPLLRRRRPLQLADLHDSLCLLPPRTARIRSLVDAEYRRQGVELPQRLIETLSYPVILGFIQELNAVALTSRHQARSAQTFGLAEPLDLSMGSLVLSIAATWLLEQPKGPVQEFVNALQQRGTGPG